MNTYNRSTRNPLLIILLSICSLACLQSNQEPYMTATGNNIAVGGPHQKQKIVIESLINLHIVIDWVQDIYIKANVTLKNIVKNIQKTVWKPDVYKQEAKVFFQEYLYPYRYQLTAAALAGLYLLCYYRLSQGNNYLADQTSWSMWQGRYTTEKLCALDPEHLAANLIHDIQMEYATAHNPTDFITPLMQFLQAIDAEIARCTTLLRWHTWVERLRICRFFGKTMCHADEISVRLQRLECIKQVFLHWIATYNIEHNKKGEQAPPISMSSDSMALIPSTNKQISHLSDYWPQPMIMAEHAHLF